MYTVLLPLDSDEARARRQAEYVRKLPCSAEEVHAILVHTMTGEERSTPAEMQRADRIGTVRTAKRLLEDAGIETEARDISHPPSEGILEIAAAEDVDEIVMGGRKRSPAEKAILGSITQSVILNADVPVTVTGSG
ncbi:Nucleotide-binding protein, UspA family [Halanaeroarchaeum sp. HSR-CO]|uniref:universal stress protein n=1 Tax=Halanaeroarchaeum sp. HSR-CO TaxID=2866382 RepID=UPI00217DCE68|nr:universal stress protein [Halanaeroarchaeum sp. HSR-CO]UWG46726.1 Nucleotide-binding protein, UspA family [Halanaeroarchaeum sp. HSR-CO]